jgi:hypothetical protein
MKIPTHVTMVGRFLFRAGWKLRDGKDAGPQYLSACPEPPADGAPRAIMMDKQTRTVRWAGPADKTAGYIYEYWANFNNEDVDDKHYVTISSVDLSGFVE